MGTDEKKEVERRRRENINDGIMEIVSQVPGGSDPKVGKGILLKRASDYLSTLKKQVDHFNVELAAKDREKQEFQVGSPEWACGRGGGRADGRPSSTACGHNSRRRRKDQ